MCSINFVVKLVVLLVFVFLLRVVIILINVLFMKLIVVGRFDILKCLFLRLFFIFFVGGVFIRVINLLNDVLEFVYQFYKGFLVIVWIRMWMFNVMCRVGFVVLCVVWLICVCILFDRCLINGWIILFFDLKWRQNVLWLILVVFVMFWIVIFLMFWFCISCFVVLMICVLVVVFWCLNCVIFFLLVCFLFMV